MIATENRPVTGSFGSCSRSVGFLSSIFWSDQQACCLTGVSRSLVPLLMRAPWGAVSDAAAHPYSYLNYSDLQYDGREVRTLECRGRPLGLFEDAEFMVWQCDLPRECELVLVSDGILELMPEESMLKRYSALLSARQGTGLDLDEMTAGLDVLADKHLPDDIAFLVISRSHADG